MCRVKIPYCPKNEHLVKKFQSKMEQLCPKVKFMIIWKTTKIKTCFPLKDRVTHKCSIIYQGKCTCGALYIGETGRCEHTRFTEHDNPKGASEPSKHLKIENGKNEGKPPGERFQHKFEWRTLTRAPTFPQKRKILEGLHIAKHKPDLNEQVNCYKLNLFRNGITWVRSAFTTSN